VLDLNDGGKNGTTVLLDFFQLYNRIGESGLLRYEKSKYSGLFRVLFVTGSSRYVYTLWVAAQRPYILDILFYVNYVQKQRLLLLTRSRLRGMSGWTRQISGRILLYSIKSFIEKQKNQNP